MIVEHMPHDIVLSQLLFHMHSPQVIQLQQHRFVNMKSLEAMEGAYDEQMKQRGQIIESDSHLSYSKMKTASFLMSPFRKCRYKSPIASVQGTCNQRT